MKSPSEFEIIQHDFIDAGFPASAKLLLGPGDDCAIIAPSANQELCLSIDTLVSGVHFPEGSPAAVVANRALMTNLSDLAAMGATPLLFTLALTLPRYEAAWMALFSDSLRAGATRYGIALAGGDLTRGPLAVTVQVMGEVPAGAALLRSGAVVDDDVYVSGTVGDAAVGLGIVSGELKVAGGDGDFLHQRFACPEPRLNLGIALRGVAHAAIDVSDGLVQDLGHIARRSGVGALVHLDRLPISAPLERLLGRAEAERRALVAGDDYELCFTAPRALRERIITLQTEIGVRVTRIGRIMEAPEILCVDRSGNRIDLPQSGYQHF